VLKVRDLVKTWPRSIFVVMRYIFAFLNHLSEYRYTPQIHLRFGCEKAMSDNRSSRASAGPFVGFSALFFYPWGYV
jgi:hypothetical protein